MGVLKRRGLAIAILLAAVGSASNNVTLASGATASADRRGFEHILAIRRAGGVQISPDGRCVAYGVTTASIEDNSYTTDTWVVATSEREEPFRVTRNGASNTPVTHNARWSPDSQMLATFTTDGGGPALCLFPVAERPSREAMRCLPEIPNTRFEWSPDGSRIAYAAADPRVGNVRLTGIQVGVEWVPRTQSQLENRSANRLHVYDLATGRDTVISPDDLDIQGFDWSPTGDRIAVSATRSFISFAQMHTDIYIVDVERADIRPIVVQPGMDASPSWSPDGGLIAFASQRGEINYLYNQDLAFVPVGGGQARYFTGPDETGRPEGIAWSENADAIYYGRRYHMTSALFRADVASLTTRRVSRDDGRSVGTPSLAANRGQIAFTVESIESPADVYISDSAIAETRRLTNLNPQWMGASQFEVEELRWRSSDDRWDIHGLLIRPRGLHRRRPLPAIVFNSGGPGMVQSEFGGYGGYWYLALAARGYAVLVPNTRGRPGYDRRFHNAIRDERSYLSHPFSDMMGGVDLLIRRGIADPPRLAIMGHSYGALLTEYSIGHTTRFRAAIDYEGGPDLLGWHHRVAASPDHAALARAMLGQGSPYDRTERELILAQSPLTHVDRVRTPTLLIYGADFLANDQGRIWFHALRAHDVESEFIVYPRSGHVITEPRLIEDAVDRAIAWLDRWVLDE